MIPDDIVRSALLCLPVVVLALSLLIVSNRCVRRLRQRGRERRAEPVRGLLMQLLCAEEDEQSELLRRLAEVDRRTWTALEPSLTALLGKVSGAARTALVRLYEERGASVEAVADLESRSAARRGRAAHVLGQLSHRAAEPSLRRLLTDRDAEIRLVAMRALGRCGGPATVPHLLDSLSGSRTVPPGAVTGALVSLGPAAQRNVAAGLDHPDPLARAVAIEVLGATGVVSRTSEIARALREDPSDEVRIRAARALGRLGMPDGLEPLLQTVGPGQPLALRIVGTGALGSLGAVSATDRLAELLGDSDRHVASTAARSLLRLGPSGQTALQTAAVGARGGQAAAQARAALAEAAVAGSRHDVRVEVPL